MGIILIEKNMSNEWLPLFYAKLIKHEEVYWPEESHSQVYGGIEVTTTNQERIGKCLVVTMELKNGNLVSNIYLTTKETWNILCVNFW